MSTRKHPPQRSCYIRRALVGASPSAIFSSCTLGLRHRTKKCKECTENVPERMLEGFGEGLRRGADVPSIQEQLRAHAMEKLKEMTQPTLTYDIEVVDLSVLETAATENLTESVEWYNDD